MKYIFFDIDGTILSRENTIPEKTIYALKKLKENGHKIFICTGRTKGYVRLQNILDIGFDGGVYGCGTMIEYDGKIKYFHKIDKYVFDYTYSYLKDNDIFCVFEGEEYLFLKHEYELYHSNNIHDERLKEKLSTQFSFAKRLKGDLGDYLKDLDLNKNNISASKFSFYTSCKEIRDGLINYCKDYFYPISHNEYVHEMVPVGHSKGSGITKLLTMNGVDKKDTISFGDSANDIDMFLSTNISVCMGSGSEVAKQNSSMVTTGFKDGIYDACVTLELI